MLETQRFVPRRMKAQNVGNSPVSVAQAISFSKLKSLGFILLHIPIGLAFFRFGSVVATAHALITLSVGLFFFLRDHQPTRVIYTAAYITGTEVLWRAAGAHIFWETGKYAVIALFLLSLVKYGRGQKVASWPIVYFALLVPSVFVLPYFDRQAIAFNLAGPFALAIAVMLFSFVHINLVHFKYILISILAPTVALAVYVLIGIVTDSNIFFGSSSNFQASGDYGPNQVSIILALGALVAIYYAVVEDNLPYRIFFLGLSLWLLAQSALTFSRSGLWTTALTLVITGIYLARSHRMGGFIFGILFLGILGYLFIFPSLENFTGNALSTRFSSLYTTGRLQIAQADLMVFSEYPIFGVGPGQSDAYHALTFRFENAHTEYTRMLAEHGMFGLLALLLLSFVVFQRLRAKTDIFSKGFLIGITAWALLFMASAATRQVAPSFLFGLAAARFDLQGKNNLEDGTFKNGSSAFGRSR